MLRNTLIKKYVGMGAIFFLAMPFSHAAQPKYTITPVISAGSNQTPNVISLLLNATVTFQYRVYNNTKRLSPPLFMKSSIPGLTQVTTDNNVCGNPFQLLPGANCILSLQMNAQSRGAWNDSDGLVINSGDGTVNVRPSPENLLNVTVSSYDDLYISYISAAPAGEIASYVRTNNLAGIIMWELRGDTPFSASSSTSLLKAIDTGLSGLSTPFIMAYWSDWNVYSNGTNRAIPEPSYPVPGSLDNNGALTTNADFTGKLEGINTIAYAFLEAQAVNFTYYDSVTMQTVTILNNTPANIGTLYFNDPWADLLKPTASSTTQNALCDDTHATTTMICNYALANRNTPISLSDGAIMGNFGAFSSLIHVASPLLKKVFSVGGYAHDDTFEDMFNHCPAGSNCITNFVNSAAAIVTAYGLDGIDLDYENPDMSYANSDNFATLVTAIKANATLETKTISVTVLSDPLYLAGKRVCSGASPTPGQAICGFNPGTVGSPATSALSIINTKATNINLMTYDYYGAFSYPGVTAFLTNLNSYSFGGASTTFSIVTSVAAAQAAGVSTPSKLSVGIPTYGRALAGISATNGGLLQPIPPTATIPRGDLDALGCSQSVGNASNTLGSTRSSSDGVNSTASCTGSFQYWYILDQMIASATVSPGLTQTDYTSEVPPIAGTTAYGVSWSPAPAPKLTITNGAPIGSSTNLAFNVAIGTNPGTYPNFFQAPDYFGLGTSITYSESVYNTASSNITPGGDLIYWKTDFASGTNFSGNCTSPLPPLTKNTVITITVNNQGVATTCTVTQ